MAFSTALTTQPEAPGSGQPYGTHNIIKTSTIYEDGIIAGRFCKYTALTGSMDKLSGEADPAIAGVVLRKLNNPIEDGAAIKTDQKTFIEVLRFGQISVDVKSGQEPTVFGKVYIDADTGEASITDTDIATNSEFLYEVKTGVWVIGMIPPIGTLEQSLQPTAYTVATLPAAADNAGVLYTCTDGNHGEECLVRSDGTNWLNEADGFPVDTTVSYTVATLPAAAAGNSGKELYVTDGYRGYPCTARSNGTAWICLSDGFVVDATLTYLKAALPDATALTGKIIVVSDGNAASTPTTAWSDGTDWINLATGAAL